MTNYKNILMALQLLVAAVLAASHLELEPVEALEARSFVPISR